MSEHQEKLKALYNLEGAAQERQMADSNYKAAIDHCASLGISNMKMAKVLGLSEVAIRRMRKRMNENGY